LRTKTKGIREAIIMLTYL